MKVFLDLDGVIVDTIPALCAQHGLPNPYDCPTGRALGKWNVHELCGVPFEQFWHLDHATWADLPPTRDALAIVDAVAQFDPEYAILTSPIHTHSCWTGKVDWVVRMLGKNILPRLIFSNRKELVAGPGKVLVDDADKNCAVWEEHGGTAVLVPRPWGTMWDRAGCDVAAYVRQALAVAADKINSSR